MSLQLLSFVFVNGISSAILIKYVTEYIYKKVSKEKDEQVLWLLSKINKLESEVSDLHGCIDTLEEKLIAKENILRESSELLFNKIDNFIISNYDTIQKTE